MRSFIDPDRPLEEDTELLVILDNSVFAVVRVQLASKALRETAKTVLEISEECGFSSASYFSKVFRDVTGLTPKQYQKQYRMSEN